MIFEVRGELRVVPPQLFFAYGKRLSDEGFGPIVLPLSLVNFRQSLQGRGDPAAESLPELVAKLPTSVSATSPPSHIYVGGGKRVLLNLA